MNYVGGESSFLSSLLSFNIGIIPAIIVALLLIIHIAFVVCMVKTVEQKNMPVLTWGIFAFLLPELAFVLLYFANEGSSDQVYYYEDNY